MPPSTEPVALKTAEDRIELLADSDYEVVGGCTIPANADGENHLC